MSIERSSWRNRKELLWSGYYPKWYGKENPTEVAPDADQNQETSPEEQLVLPALFILVQQEREHEPAT